MLNKARRFLRVQLCIPYHYFGISKVKTKKGNISIVTYVDLFTKNLFDCLRSCSAYRTGDFNVSADVPDRVFHGTSTKFLSSIMKEGLVPSKYGQCWKEDKENKSERVYFTDSLYAAELFAEYARCEVGGGAIVLEINIESIKKDMEINMEDGVGASSTTFDLYKELSYGKSLGRELITDWYIVPKMSGFAQLNYFIEAVKH